MSDWNQSTIPHSGLTPEDKKIHIFYIILYNSDFDILFEILKSVWKYPAKSFLRVKTARGKVRKPQLDKLMT